MLSGPRIKPTSSFSAGGAPLSRRLSTSFNGFGSVNNTGTSFDSRLADQIDNVDDDKRKSKWELLRHGTKNFIENSVFGGLYIQFLLLVSVLSCFEFIYQTYLDLDTDSGVRTLDFFTDLELGVAGLFAFDWMLMLFISDHKGSQLFRFYFVVGFKFTLTYIFEQFLLLRGSLDCDPHLFHLQNRLPFHPEHRHDHRGCVFYSLWPRYGAHSSSAAFQKVLREDGGRGAALSGHNGSRHRRDDPLQ
jgi:hypothetical protein